jgi:excisionase family DNA binding protein
MLELIDGPDDGTTTEAVEQHFRPEDTAARIAVTVPTVRALERRGELRGVRIAGRLRFSASAINEYLKRAAMAPRRTPPPELLAHGGRPRGRRRR